MYPTTKGLSTSDGMFCLPSLGANLIRGEGGDGDLFSPYPQSPATARHTEGTQDVSAQ